MLILEHNLKRKTPVEVKIRPVTAVPGAIRTGKTTIVNALQFAIEKKIGACRFGSDVMQWAAKDEKALFSRISGTITASSSSIHSSSPWSLTSYCDLRSTGKYGITQDVRGEAPQLMLLCPGIDRVERNPLTSRAPTVAAAILQRFGGTTEIEVADWMRTVCARVGIVLGPTFNQDSWTAAQARIKELNPPRRQSDEDAGPDEETTELAGTVDPEAVLQRLQEGALERPEAIRQLLAYADSTARFRRLTAKIDAKELEEAEKIVAKLSERLIQAGPAAAAEKAINGWLEKMDMRCRLGPKGTWEVEGADKEWHNASACGSERALFRLGWRMAWASMGSIVCVDDGELGPLQTDARASKQWATWFAHGCLSAGALAVLFIGARYETAPDDAHFIGE